MISKSVHPHVCLFVKERVPISLNILQYHNIAENIAKFSCSEEKSLASGPIMANGYYKNLLSHRCCIY